MSSDGIERYHIGIIDYLQAWNFAKMSEQRWKSLILKRDRRLISAVEPELYAKRFLKFVNERLCQRRMNHEIGMRAFKRESVLVTRPLSFGKIPPGMPQGLHPDLFKKLPNPG